MILKVRQDKMREMACEWIDKNEKMIIEIGCASGNFAELLHQRGIMNYLGIDIKEDQIKEAKKRLPEMQFKCCDATKTLEELKSATTFAAFQCLEHIQNDLDILKAIDKGTKIIISVPNSPYKGRHVRWFEADGWADRFSPFMEIEKTVVIQHPTKKAKRSFLFKGVKK